MNPTELHEQGSDYLLLGEVAEEVNACLEAGGTPDIEALAARHPALAEQVRQLVPALAALHQLGQSGAAVAAPGEALGQLGDFRILREVGRGGMGVVYEAEQVSIGRRVALKVLPFAAALDERHLRRFKHEVQAAGHLHHQHIVPVYAVGCERGVHYYAMQFIDGQPLTATIRELRQLAGLDLSEPRPSGSGVAPPLPDGRGSEKTAAIAALSTEHSVRDPGYFRTVAHLGVQAAEALEHAHSLGVLHRDIKPGNLLLQWRAGGVNPPVLWVTDFGLAHFQGEAGLTLTGDVVGTLRYMSPEQALGRREQVDHRTDLYALGATLYELLTLEPVFSGHNREELLRRTERDEPRPPRQLNPAVPAELETIVLKALAKEPGERYATAQELADDLGRFLRNEPIRAKRPTLLQRVRKWVWRHQPVAWSVAVSTFVMLVGAVVTLSVSTLLIANERNAAQEAAQRAINERATAERERQRADANLTRARAVVDNVLIQIVKDLVQVPRTEQLRRSLMLDALEFYKGLLRESVDDPELRMRTALCSMSVGRFHHLLGDDSQGERAWLDAIVLLEKLHSDFPHEPEYREQLADCYAHLASCHKQASRWDKELEAGSKTLSLYEGLAADFPKVFNYRGRVVSHLVHLGGILGRDSRRRDEVDSLYQRAFAVHEQSRTDFPEEPEDWETLAYLHRGYGVALTRANRLPESEKHLRQSLRLYEDLTGKSRESNWQSVLDPKTDLARLLNKTARPAEAEQLYREMVETWQRKVDDFPHAMAYWTSLERRQEEWGLTLFCLNRLPEAEIALRNCLETRTKLANAIRDDDPNHWKGVAWGHYHLGELLRETGRMGEAAEQFREALRLFERNAAQFPDLPRSHYHLAWVLAACPDPQFRDPARAVRHAQQALQGAPETGVHWTCLGIAQFRGGQWQAAIDAFEKALRLHPDCDGFEWFFLAMAQWHLGQKEKARQAYANGVEWLKQRPVVELEVRPCCREAAALLGIEAKPD